MSEDVSWCVVDPVSSTISAHGGGAVDPIDWLAVVDAVGPAGISGRRARVEVGGRIWSATAVTTPFGTVYTLERDHDRAALALLHGVRSVVHDVNNALGVIATTTWVSDRAPSLDDLSLIRGAVERAVTSLRDVPDAEWPPDVDVSAGLVATAGFFARTQPRGVSVVVREGPGVVGAGEVPLLRALEAVVDVGASRDEQIVLSVAAAEGDRRWKIDARRGP